MTAVVTVNQAKGERLAEYPAFSDADVDAALDRAASVQAGWADLSFPDRAAVLHRAREFNVVVAENMFGDILSDLAGELPESLGIAPSVNASEDRAMAQAAPRLRPGHRGEGAGQPDRDDPLVGDAARLAGHEVRRRSSRISTN
jgi:acyl-CoA reductase-like NAD-dependent aldehyde dehydrogenase